MEVDNIWYEVKSQNQTIVVGVVYRHPGIRNDITKFIHEMDAKLDALSREGVKRIVWEPDHRSFENTPNTFINSTMSNGFIPTRITDYHISLLDHILLKVIHKDIKVEYHANENPLKNISFCLLSSIVNWSD